ncbi:hypothetical protein PSHT_13433 [Puccinia striiformis]|uniref:Uncharacterized protein n=1 Tax=Puccinia striiformis TaxID=27350 RepID=A0A2S4UR38_9BASI|nr:hypothetical protein PSHT_13433 [Puccinia striiformis]
MEKEAGSELERFVKLHAQHDGTTELFYKLEKAAGLFQHNEELDSLFGFNKRDFREEVIITDRWADFTAGKTESLETLMKKLELTREADGEKIKTLIRRAHFVRFPECDASELTVTKMLHALGFSRALAKQIVDATPQINWSTEIVQQGFNEEYQGHDLIVIPTLETLQLYATQWREDAYKAPYTSIISPTMSGKTRLLKELAKHVCVVYVCLRKDGSTCQPPRSHLARHFIPEEPKLNMIRHYSHLLIAILNTVSDFFSQPDRRTKSLKDLLFEWFDYSFQMDNTPKSEFNLKVEKELKERSQQPDRSYRQTTPDSILSRVSSGFIGNTFLNGVLQRLHRYDLRIANFNPALDRDPCSRFHSRGVGLFTPIYKISAFDAFVSQRKAQLGELKKTPEDAVQATAMIAEAKLLFKTQSASPGKLSSPQCFAILGSIIQTRVSLHAPINSELVASHAAHCVYIDAKRKMIVSDYPPQFVYASAANRVLASDDKRWIECIDALADAVKKGLVASGDAGEMATRLILIRAMQKTKPIAHKNHRFDPNRYSVQLEISSEP